ncbi:hypothetical protein QP888_05575 [Corynebacterium sp. MSK297]|nr:hypothetical protein [Corynebacterium sp. MSK297]MDK8845982.1 hypothetical protein [Corynebacterium sp. MSK297]
MSDTPNGERDVLDRMEELTGHRARFAALKVDRPEVLTAESGDL